MNIVLYKGNFNYNVVNYFVDELEDKLKSRGYNVFVVDLEDCKKDEVYQLLINEKINLILSFNGINVLSVDVYEKLNIIFGMLLVDHPLYHLNRIKAFKSKNTFVSVLDEGSTATVEKYIDNNIILTHLMHGGSYDKLQSKNKKYNVVMLGGLKKPPIDKVKKMIKNIDSYGGRLGSDIKELLREDYKTTLDEKIEETFRKYNIQEELLKTEGFQLLLSYIYTTIDEYGRIKCRYDTLKTLLEHDIEVDYFGNCTCDDFDKFDNFINHGAVSYEEALSIMANSKILVNTIGYFKNGSHERVFSAMLNKALVISNINHFSYDIYKHKENIVYFDPNDKNQLINEVNYYLKNERDRKTIVNNAYEITAKYNTWENRVDEIIEIYNLIRNM